MTYTAAWVKFLWHHIEELSDSGGIPEHLRMEYAALPMHRSCTCDINPIRMQERIGRGEGSAAEVASLGMPGSDWLDLARAYSALPMGWRSRTRLYLMKQGWTEQQVWDLPLAEFQARHRRRITLETFQPTNTKSPTPAPMVPERGSVWAWMANWLNGGPSTAPDGTAGTALARAEPVAIGA